MKTEEPFLCNIRQSLYFSSSCSCRILSGTGINREQVTFADDFETINACMRIAYNEPAALRDIKLINPDFQEAWWRMH